VDLAGTVALLLWGVHMVQSGIQRAFGAGLRRFLSRRLDNRPGAFLAGLGVTAVLQSSTATGLMVTGFTAEGLVRLAPGLAAMLGANVGTTLIVQLLSFNVLLAAPALVLAGYVLFRRARAGVRDFGRVLIGLGLILLALHQFEALLEPLAANPMTHALLTGLSAHIVFIVLIGALLGWAAHSSVAIVLLAMTFAGNGVLSVPAGIALALGANLGTAINPVLEGTAHGPASRRLPLGNLLNRLVGVFLVLALFPLVPPLVSAIEATPARAVANFHSGFNLVLAVLFFPLLAPYARWLERMLPERPDPDAPDAPRFLEAAPGKAPAAALGSAAREALRLADVLEEMLNGLAQALGHANRRRIEETKRLDDVLDGLTSAIKNYLLAIDPERLDEGDGRWLARILAFAINIEQAGDIVDHNLLDIASRRMKRGLAFSPEGEADLVGQVGRLIANLRAATALFLSGDPRAARELAAEKQAFRDMEDEAMAAHFKRLRSGDIDAVETSALHLDALRDLKRVNAHLIEAAAYPILKESGDLLPTRIRRTPPAIPADSRSG